MTQAHPLSSRTVILTGAAGLLGREYARALTMAGAFVVMTDLDEHALMDSAAATGRPHQIRTVAADLTTPDNVRHIVATTLAWRPTIDGLVNNAAVNPQFDAGRARHMSAFEDFPLAQWTQALSVNLTGLFLITQAVVPAMRAQRHGAIVNVASTYGIVGPDQRLYATNNPEEPQEYKPVTYTVTKSGVIGFTRYLATYLAGTGVRVNTLSPGGVRHAQSDEFQQRYAAKTPLGRMAERHEYNEALLFLLSDASSYMTGANLVVDGGWTAW